MRFRVPASADAGTLVRVSNTYHRRLPTPAYRLPDQHPLVLPGVRMDLTGDHLPSWVCAHRQSCTGGDTMAPTPLAANQPSNMSTCCIRPTYGRLLDAAAKPCAVSWPHDLGHTTPRCASPHPITHCLEGSDFDRLFRAIAARPLFVIGLAAQSPGVAGRSW